MIKPQLPSNEAERLAALRQLQILDTPAEAAFDDLTMVAATICATPQAALTLIDAQRQWFKAATGAARGEAPRAISFCAHAILDPDRILLVEDTLQDPRFHDNPMSIGTPPVRFYAGAPLLSQDGFALGTLCVFGDHPAHLSQEQQRALMALSRQASYLVQLHSVSRRLEKQLRERDWYEQQLAQYQASLESLNADLLEQSRTDPLTGLFNRRAFASALLVNVEAAQLDPTPLAVALLDLDYFKNINDLHGHDKGDAVLRALADMLRAQAPPGCLVARYGGEEFAVLMPGLDAQQAMHECETLRQETSLLRLGLPLTASFGVAAHLPGESAEQLLKRADLALYQAKRAGRDCVALAE
ncbi:sensor domain-containing diguanylate cyclase [Xanthomonas sp. AM6]|uniref:GGDEF domain-containing protein n=1 Tax=Xanthomonas sp. AM6 TaxID=2982531 RepID=UPI0021DB2DD1|nr:sensor domain-containing diguanylate cyclase [Xanthomonas sp. AM6]UYB53719.1 sensor domain-containing diguanylate cyclase [Xanthomonas sp. AM6]